MALNSSGPISLAGTTAGQSIEIENGGNGTTQISLNDAAVRSLAGVASGQITMPTDFWGKSNNTFFVGLWQSMWTGGIQAAAGKVYYYARNIGTGKAGWLAFDSGANVLYNKIFTGGTSSSQPPCALWYSSAADRLFANGAEYTTQVTASTGNFALFTQTADSYLRTGNVSGSGSTFYSGGVAVYPGCYGDTELGYLWSLNTSGSFNWRYRASVTQLQYVRGVTAYPNGTVIAGGDWNYSGVYRPTLWAFNSSGSNLWNTYNASLNTSGYGIISMAANSTGSIIYTVGRTNTSNCLIQKILDGGTVQWARQLVWSGGGLFGASVCVDSSDNVYVMGEYGYTGSGNPMFLAKYDSSGNLQWQRNISKNNDWMFNANFNGLAYDGAGGIVFGCLYGYYSRSGFFGKVPADGSKTGTYTMADGQGNFIYSVATLTSSSLSVSTSTGDNNMGTFGWSATNYSGQTVGTGPSVLGKTNL